jgi:uncharacterized protein
MPAATGALHELRARVQAMGRVAIAVSGGVDSVTLSVVAHRALGTAARMYHAVSPAVPVEATERVRRYARREGWSLEVLDAGEFHDQRYRTNPVDRCYYCKTNLYGAIAYRIEAPIFSGANTDDLGDYRPGLDAAQAYGVRHPYVESGIDKAGVRAIARLLGLWDLASLPAAPCLASRIETGLPIEPPVLSAVHATEQLLRELLAPQVVRCRVRQAGITIELDGGTLEGLPRHQRQSLAQQVAKVFQPIGLGQPVDFTRYRMGSAFLHESRHGTAR